MKIFGWFFSRAWCRLFGHRFVNGQFTMRCASCGAEYLNLDGILELVRRHESGSTDVRFS